MSMTVPECTCTHRDNCTQALICEETRSPKQSVNLIRKPFWQERLTALKKLLRLPAAYADVYQQGVREVVG